MVRVGVLVIDSHVMDDRRDDLGWSDPGRPGQILQPDHVGAVNRNVQRVVVGVIVNNQHAVEITDSRAIVTPREAIFPQIMGPAAGDA